MEKFIFKKIEFENLSNRCSNSISLRTRRFKDRNEIYIFDLSLHVEELSVNFCQSHLFENCLENEASNAISLFFAYALLIPLILTHIVRVKLYLRIINKPK